MDTPPTVRHQDRMVEKMIDTGDIHPAMLSLVRAVLASAVVGVACYKEVVGSPASDSFYMLVGLVMGMYFEKGAALAGFRSVKTPPPEGG